MDNDIVIDFLDGAFPRGSSVRRTLSIPAGSVVGGRMIEEVVKKFEECFRGGAERGAVYFRQGADGSYEFRTYVPVKERII